MDEIDTYITAAVQNAGKVLVSLDNVLKGKGSIQKQIPLIVLKGRDKKMRVLVQTTTFQPFLWCTNAVDEN